MSLPLPGWRSTDRWSAVSPLYLQAFNRSGSHAGGRPPASLNGSPAGKRARPWFPWSGRQRSAMNLPAWVARIRPAGRQARLRTRETPWGPPGRRAQGRAGVQRRRRALHPDAQGGVHPLARLRNPRGGQGSDRGLHRALQQRLASPAARVSNPGSRPREAQPQGGLMFRPAPCPEDRVRYRLHDLLQLPSEQI